MLTQFHVEKEMKFCHIDSHVNVIHISIITTTASLVMGFFRGDKTWDYFNREMHGGAKKCWKITLHVQLGI